MTVNIKDDSRGRQTEMKMVNKTSEITRKTGNMQTVSQLASHPLAMFKAKAEMNTIIRLKGNMEKGYWKNWE